MEREYKRPAKDDAAAWSEFKADPALVNRIKAYLDNGNVLSAALIVGVMTIRAQDIVDNKEAMRKDLEHSFISADAYIHCAEEWLRQFPDYRPSDAAAEGTDSSSDP